MKKILFCIPILLSYIVASGCSNTGQIDGMVVDRLTKEPVAEAIIKVEGTQLSTKSDALGKFTIKEVVPGQQNISATKDGYDKSQSITLAIAKGTVSKPVALELACISDSCAHVYKTGVTGTFLDFITETPLSGVSVKAPNNEVQTDENGHYKLMNLLPNHSYEAISARKGYAWVKFEFSTQGPKTDAQLGVKKILPFPEEGGWYGVSNKQFAPLTYITDFMLKRGLLNTPMAYEGPPIVYLSAAQVSKNIKPAQTWLVYNRAPVLEEHYILPLVNLNSSRYHYTGFGHNIWYDAPAGYYCGITRLTDEYLSNFGVHFKSDSKPLKSFQTIRGQGGIEYINISFLPIGKYILCNFQPGTAMQYMPKRIYGYIFEKVN